MIYSGDVTFSLKGKRYSLYDDDELLQDIIPSGGSYLVLINPSSQLKTKTQYIKSMYNNRRLLKLY